MKQKITQRKIEYRHTLQTPSKSQFPSNYIRTTKYNFFNFLPLSIFNEMKKPQNLYFLLIAILNSISRYQIFTNSAVISPL